MFVAYCMVTTAYVLKFLYARFTMKFKTTSSSLDYFILYCLTDIITIVYVNSEYIMKNCTVHIDIPYNYNTITIIYNYIHDPVSNHKCYGGDSDCLRLTNRARR